jgi:hypothetical protein
MIKHFLEEPDDIALAALGPIVVTGYRLQDLDQAKGTKIGDHLIGHHRIPKNECLWGLRSYFLRQQINIHGDIETKLDARHGLIYRMGPLFLL